MTSTLATLHAKRREAREKGFTLVELAVVLVIIGLIVGGVLVGQDLIRAAEVRATISDLESYNTAANTFRTKYNGYPGDLLATRAQQFGLVNAPAVGDGVGDGDGVLENGGTLADKAGFGGETQAFWEHLSAAGYIKQGFSTLLNGNAGGDGTPNGDLLVAPGVTLANLPVALPASRSRETTYIHAYSFAGRNFYLMSNISTAVAATTGNATTGAGMTVSEALNIDEKMDDGDPLGGTVTAVVSTDLTNGANGIIEPNGAAIAAAQAPAVGVCVENVLNGYNATSEDFLNAVACQVRIRASF